MAADLVRTVQALLGRFNAHLKSPAIHAHGIMDEVRSILGRRCFARAYRSATITGLTASAWTTVPLDAETEDADGLFNTTTYIYTVPASGLYHIDYGVRLYNTSGGTINLGVRITHDGTATLLHDFQDAVPAASLGGVELGKPGVRRFAKGDGIRVQYYSSSTSCNIIHGDGITWLAVIKT